MKHIKSFELFESIRDNFKVGDMVYVDPFGPSTFGYSSDSGTIESDKPFKPKLLNVNTNTKYEITSMEGSDSYFIFDDSNKVIRVSGNQISKTTPFEISNKIWDIIGEYLQKGYSLQATVNDIIKLDSDLKEFENEIWDILEKSKRSHYGIQSVYDDINRVSGNKISKTTPFENIKEGKAYAATKTPFEKDAWDEDKKEAFRKKIEDHIKSQGCKAKQIGNDFEIHCKTDHIGQVVFRNDYVGVKKKGDKLIKEFDYKKLGEIKKEITNVIKSKE